MPKKKYRNLFFDLDGTVTESGPGIMNSAKYALATEGIIEEDEEKLRLFIGPPLVEMFTGLYHADAEMTSRLVKAYREAYTKEGIYQNRLYPGIVELLKELRNEGYHIYIATGKPDRFTMIVLEYYDLLQYFDGVAAATMAETGARKEEVIKNCMKNYGITDPETVLMIGDRKHDIIGAKANGVDFLGVLYGYGTKEEMEAEGASDFAETIEDVRKFILG